MTESGVVTVHWRPGNWPHTIPATQGLLDSGAEMASPCHMGQEEVSFSVLSVAAEEALRLGEVETYYLEVRWADRDRHAHCPL